MPDIKRMLPTRFSLKALLCALAVFSAAFAWYVRVHMPEEQKRTMWALKGLLGQLAGQSGVHGWLDVISTRGWGEPLNESRQVARVHLFPVPATKLSAKEEEIWGTLRNLDSLRALSAAGRADGDDEVLRIAGHRNLLWLNLSGVPVSSATIQTVVERTPSLRWLILTDGQLAALAGIQLLQWNRKLVMHVIPADHVPTDRIEAFLPHTDDPVPPWLRDEFIVHHEYEKAALDACVRLIRVHSAMVQDIDNKGSSALRWLRQVAALPDVLVCEFSFSDMADEHLESIAGVSKVVYLSIAQTRVTPASAESLKKLTSLRVLHLDDTLLTPEVLDVVGGLPRLRWLTVDCPRLPYSQAETVRSRLPNVTVRFRLTGPTPGQAWNVEWDGPDWAAELHGDWTLKSRDEMNTAIISHPLHAFRSLTYYEVEPQTRAALRYLPYVPSLATINWQWHGPVDDTAIQQLGAVTQIKHLEIATDVTASSFEPWSELQRLEDLTLNCAQLNSNGVKSLAQVVATLSRLESLSLDQATITPDIVSELQACARLRVLRLRGCKLERHTEKLFAEMPQLSSLEIDGVKTERAQIKE